MLSPDQYNAIATKYGHYDSWAVWAEEGLKPKSNVGDLSVFDIELNPGNIDVLNPEIIMVGLNISRPVEHTFANFHDKRPQSQDYKIRFAFRGTEFYGAYMTDIIKDFEQLISGEVMSYLRENRHFELQNIELFRQELADIGAKNPTVIAFGNHCYSILDKHFRDELRIVRVPHYSMQISKEKYRNEVLRLLSLDEIKE